MPVRQRVAGHEHLRFIHPMRIEESNVGRSAAVTLTLELHGLDQRLVAQTDVGAILCGQRAAPAARLALDTQRTRLIAMRSN
jgi:hypothetical protein